MSDRSRVPCPNCRTPVDWTVDTPWRPFCSERCRMVDLGAWLQESNTIPGVEIPEEGIDTVDTDSDAANRD